VLGLLAGCRSDPRDVDRPTSVVILLIDTLRADHLGSFGYERPTTPHLDELASHSIVFENTVSAGAATFPSINSLFTSKEAVLFFRTSSRDLGIPDGMTTLAEVLNEHGYATRAISASPIVRATPSEFNAGGGFGQGFEVFNESCSDPRALVPDYIVPCVVAETVSTLRELPSDQPFFVYVHFLDPHDPYQPPEDPEGFVGPYEGIEFIAQGRTWPLNKWLTTGEGEDPGATPDDIRHLMDLYDAEIRGADEGLRQVMAAFREVGRFDDTLFVILSDHGESFLENGALQHSYSLYQTELHVPLLFHWPARWPEGARRNEVVCSVDVYPTILDLLKIDPPGGIAGTPLLSGEPGGRRACLSAGRSSWHAALRNLSSLRVGRWKLIHERASDRYELYNLEDDPGELHNLAPTGDGDGPEVFARMKTLLDERIAQALAEAPEAPGQVELSPEAEQALRSLGYID
jgi:arylsulfatase A-like enzyme